MKKSYKKFSLKTMLSALLVLILAFNSAPLNQIEAAAPELTDQFQTYSPETITYTNYKEGDLSPEIYKGQSVDLQVEFKLKDKNDPKGALIAHVKMVGNRERYYWPGKVFYTVSVPNGFNYMPSTVITDIWGTYHEEYQSHGQFVNSSYHDYADLNTGNFNDNYTDYITPWSEAYYNSKFSREFKNGTYRLLTLKKYGVIGAKADYNVEYQAEIPASMRGQTTTIIASQKKSTLGSYLRAAAYTFKIPPVPVDPSIPKANWGVASLPQDQILSLEPGQGVHELTQSQKAELQKRILAANENLDTKIDATTKIIYPTEDWDNTIIFRFDDGSEYKSHYSNFIKKVNKAPESKPGTEMWYTSNKGRRFKIVVPNPKVHIDDEANHNIRGTNETINGNDGNVEMKTLCQAIVNNDQNGSRADKSYDQVNTDSLPLTLSTDRGEKVRVASESGSLFTSTLDPSTYYVTQTYKQRNANDKVKFYVYEKDNFTSDGKYKQEFTDEYIEFPLRDAIENPGPAPVDTSVTQDDKNNAMKSINSFNKLTDAEKQAYKDQIDKATDIDTINNVIKEAQKINDERVKKDNDLAALKAAAKNKITGADNTNSFPDLTNEQIADLVKRIDAAGSEAEINQILAEAAQLDFASKKAKAKAIVETYDDGVAGKTDFLTNIENAKDKSTIDKILADAKLANEKFEAKKRVDEAVAKHPEVDPATVAKVKADIDAATVAGKPTEIANAFINGLLAKEKEKAKEEVNKLIDDYVANLDPKQQEEIKNDINDAINNAKSDEDIANIIDAAKALAKLNEAKAEIDKLQHLNNNQKKSLKESLEPGLTLADIEAVLSEARQLDDSMAALETMKAKGDEFIKNHPSDKLKALLDKAKILLTKEQGGDWPKMPVDQLTKQIYDAIKELDPNASVDAPQAKLDIQGLEKAVNEATTVKESNAYKYDKNPAAKAAYDNAVTEGQALLDAVKTPNHGKTQRDIINAMNKINEAKARLTGSKPPVTKFTVGEAQQKVNANGNPIVEVTLQGPDDQPTINGKVKVYNGDTEVAEVEIVNNKAVFGVNEELKDLPHNTKLQFVIAENEKTESPKQGSLTLDKQAPEAITVTKADINENNILISLGDTANGNNYQAGDIITVTAGNDVLVKHELTAAEIAAKTVTLTPDKGKQLSTKTPITVTVADKFGNEAKATNSPYTPTDKFEELSAEKAEAVELQKTPEISYHVSDANKKAYKTAKENLAKAITNADNVIKDKTSTPEAIAEAKKQLEAAKTAFANAQAANQADAQNFINGFIDALNLDAEQAKALKDEVKALDPKKATDQSYKDIQDKAVEKFKTANPAIKGLADQLKAEATTADDLAAVSTKIKDMLGLATELGNLKPLLEAKVKNQVKYLNEPNADNKTAYDTALTEAIKASGYDEAKKEFTPQTTATAATIQKVIADLKAKEEALTGTLTIDSQSKILISSTQNPTAEDVAAIKAKILADNPELQKAEKIVDVTYDAAKKKIVVTYNNEGLTEEDASFDAPKEIAVTDVAVDSSTYANQLQKFYESLVKEIENDGNNITDKAALKEQLEKAYQEQKTTLSQTKTQAEAEALVLATKKALPQQILQFKRNEIINDLQAKNIDSTEIGTELDKLVAAGTDVAKDASDADRINAMTANLLAMNKLNAKQNLADAAKKAEADINELTNIDADKKQAALDQIAAALDMANQYVDKATSVSKVKTVSDAAEINNAYIVNKARIDDAYATKLEEINNSTASQAQKDLDKQRLNELLKAETDKLDSAKTSQETAEATVAALNKAGDASVLAFSKLKVNSATDEALAKIKAAVDKKTKEIEASDAKPESKQAAIDEVNAIAKKAVDKIKGKTDDKTTRDEIEFIGDQGAFDIEHIKIPTAKDDAIKAVEEAAKQKKDEINKSDAGDAAKNKAKAEVDNAAKEAIKKIKEAADDATVDTAKNDGVDTIDNVKVPTKKSEVEEAARLAKEKIKEAQQKQLDKIEASDATDEQKEEAKKKVNAKVDAAIKAIDDIVAGDADDDTKIKEIQEVAVEFDKDSGNEGNIPMAEDLAQAKKAAKENIDKALEKKLAEIEAIDSTVDSTVTPELKEKYKEVAKKLAEAAKAAVDVATTIPEVRKEGSEGVKNIEAIEVPSGKSLDAIRAEAIEQIKAAKEAKIAAIKAVANADAEEVAKKVELVEKIAEQAIQNLEAAKTTLIVKEELKTGLEDIEQVSLPESKYVGEDNAKAQKKAIADIEKALELKTREIELSDSDKKEELKAYARSIADIEIAKVKATTTVEAAEQAGDEGVARVRGIEIPAKVNVEDQAALDAARKAATDAIDEALKAKVAKIEATEGANDKAKQTAIKEATAEASAGKQKINLLDDIAAIGRTQDETISRINAVEVDMHNPVHKDLTDALAEAMKAIDEAVEKKKAEIDKQGKNVEAKKQELDKLAELEKLKLKDAKTLEELTKTKEKAIAKIENFRVDEIEVTMNLDEAKTKAQEMLKQALDAKIAEIKSGRNSDAVKAKYIKLATAQYEMALSLIDIAKSAEEVILLADKYVTKIKAIKMPQWPAAADDSWVMIDLSGMRPYYITKDGKDALPKTGESNNNYAMIAMLLALGATMTLGLKKMRKSESKND